MFLVPPSPDAEFRNGSSNWLMTGVLVTRISCYLGTIKSAAVTLVDTISICLNVAIFGRYVSSNKCEVSS